ncbi:MAG: hypothetical protein JWO83_233, partial [Caulobacteraceae bacterium]|nr:hypothetical protein [Caulobacteraceae bacterium]
YLRMHAIPPAETGQIVCYENRTYRVLPTALKREPAVVALAARFIL